MSAMSTEHRLAAERRVNDLIAVIRALPRHDHLTQMMEEAESLARAIAAFHLEGIRFRMYNVDRMATPFREPLYPDEQWQAFLRQQGYTPFTPATFVKEVAVA